MSALMRLRRIAAFDGKVPACASATTAANLHRSIAATTGRHRRGNGLASPEHHVRAVPRRLHPWRPRRPYHRIAAGRQRPPCDAHTWTKSSLLNARHQHSNEKGQEYRTNARKAVQSSPGFSIPYVSLAAALAKLGRLQEAKAAAARVLELQPVFRFNGFLTGVNCEPTLASTLSEALRAAGLPE